MTASLKYDLFGLLIESEIELRGIPQSRRPGLVDVTVRLGSIPQTHEAGEGYVLTDDGALLSVGGVGRFLIRPSEVVVEPTADAPERNVRLYLLGSAMGALLHQRGLLPLHANAVDLGGHAIAFAGHSGAGKSTLAAWFQDKGYRILADDVCVLAFDPSGVPLAYPGIPRLRLWREALEASGREAGQYERSFDGMEKYDVPALDLAGLEPRPLGAVYLLRQADQARIVRLAGVAAVDALVANTYRGGYLTRIGRTAGHLDACLRIAKSVPVFQAERRWGFDCFEDEAARLEAHAASLPVPA